MTYGLTAQQRKALDVIILHIKRHGVSPSLAEICVGLGLSPVSRSTAQRLVRELKALGHIDFLPRRSRSIIVPPQRSRYIALPPKVRADLEAFCRATGEAPEDVVADAVSLHLDELAMEEAA